MEVMLLLLLLSSSFFLSASSIFLSNETDMLSLIAFKAQITNDPSKAISSWNKTNHFCDWTGVSCTSSKHPQRVTALNLSSSGLAGYISPFIANLSFIRNLILEKNNFYGKIPPEIGRLRRLQLLDLSDNSLHGEIPENITYCSNLMALDLTSNALSGKIPVELGALKKMELFALSNNSLDGTIWASIGNLTSLNHLALRTNRFEGKIPNELGNLYNLQYFQVSDNKFSGMIPSTLFNLSSLYYFGIAANSLEGTLPSSMGTTLPNLERIVFGGNQLQGQIPISLSNASKLSFVDMSINSLIGEVPPDLGRLSSLEQLNLELNQIETNTHGWEFINSLANCSQLRLLSLYSNNLSGELPKSVGNLSTNLEELRLNANQISGTIPPEIENLVNLTVLALGPNLITGIIPENIGKLTRLQLLTLYKSKLIGNIPSSLGNLTQLLYLYLTGNNFEGPIPSSLGKLQELEELGLGNNEFSGSIPKEFFHMSSLRAFGLSSNSLVGSIPSETSNMKSLRALYIARNKLSGEIPSSLGDLQFIDTLNLSQNLLSGEIPSSFSKLKGLQQLDLSQNNLSGPIPTFLENLTLVSVNLSYNHFEGEVPMKGIFENATATSLQGNTKLCGGVSEFHFSSCPSISTRRKRLSKPIKILIAIAIVLLCLLLFTCTLVFIYWRAKLRTKPITLPPSSEDQYHRVSHAELTKATNGFSSTNLIGKGSHGSVYKGSLDNGNTLVAVKIFNLEQQGASKSFSNECEALRNIRHRNLIKILTSCSSVDSRGNEFKALVFEFMGNGNLETWLHAKNGYETLGLMQRLNIAIDVADALDYLHHDCQTPIIHCDLKPSNILLNDDMVAHVGDFGLARLLLEMSKPLRGSSCSIGIRGTIGYVAPEYGGGGLVSAFGDVYSYGIVLLEMLTGKRPVSDMFRDGENLHKFVEMALPDRIVDIIDPSLLLQQGEGGDFKQKGDTDSDSRTRIQECISSIARVGLQCSKESPRERMDMRSVAAEMHRIRDRFIRVGVNG